MASVEVHIAASGDDGRVRKVGATYPPSGAEEVLLTNTIIEIQRHLSGGTYRNFCGLLRFDTSVVPVGSTITSATLGVRTSGTAIGDADGRTLDAEWYSGNAWADSGTATGTYVLNVGTDALVVDLTGLTTVTDYNWSLTNPENVVAGGWTGIRLGISGGQPTGLNEIFLYSWDHSTQPEPTLTVTYELAASKIATLSTRAVGLGYRGGR